MTPTLDEYVADARALEPEPFRQRHGDAFLVHHGPLGALRVPPKPQRTVTLEAVAAAAGLEPQRDYLVFPVRRSGRSAIARFITVGRTRNNDVCIPYVSVSKFHAFFTQDAPGRFLLQDAGSHNGTLADDRTVPVHDQGRPVALQSGARIVLGAVKLTFLYAADFRELARRLGG
ncbi:MAG: FHA domain-containing protein [Deltaproteobacteria bacterium]|nr:FHA domain-containing protein [Deltaproteobacteria bacterium]